MKLLLITTLLAATAFAEDDGKLTIEIPSAAQAAIAKEKGEKGKVRDFKRVSETDGTIYVVGLVLDGKNYLLSLDAAGRVMRKQLDVEEVGPKTMKIADVPAKVREALQREAGAGVIEEDEQQEQKPTFVTEVVIAKRKYRITVDTDGTLLNKEYVGDDEEK